jgi:hypothetical protein
MQELNINRIYFSVIVCLSLFYIIIFCHLQLSTALIYVQIRNLNLYLPMLYYISKPLHNIRIIYNKNIIWKRQ